MTRVFNISNRVLRRRNGQITNPVSPISYPPLFYTPSAHRLVCCSRPSFLPRHARQWKRSYCRRDRTYPIFPSCTPAALFRIKALVSPHRVTSQEQTHSQNASNNALQPLYYALLYHSCYDARYRRFQGVATSSSPTGTRTGTQGRARLREAPGTTTSQSFSQSAKVSHHQKVKSTCDYKLPRLDATHRCVKPFRHMMQLRRFCVFKISTHTT